MGGLMGNDLFSWQDPNTTAYWYLEGHGGQDYGSSSAPYFSPLYNFSLVVGQGSEYGKNCSLTDFTANANSYALLYCKALDVAIQTFAPEDDVPPKLDCSFSN